MPDTRMILPGTETDLPTFTIKINEAAIARTYEIVSVDVIKEINKIPTAKIILFDGSASDQDFAVSNEDVFIPGNEIEITAGYHGIEETIFKGIITKHSLKIRQTTQPQLILECKDVAIQLTIARKSRYFFDKKDSDIITGIIDEYDLENDIHSTEETHKEVVQFDATDWDFIIARMESNGLFCVVDDGKVKAIKPDFNAPVALQVLFGSTILEFDAELDAKNQLSSLQSKTWSYTNQEVVSADATDPGITENGNFSSSKSASVLNISDYTVTAGEPLTETELQSVADARLLKLRLSRVRGRVKCIGVNNIKPAAIVKLNGVGERFNGDVFVSAVHHQLAGGNYTTNIQFGLDAKPFAIEAEFNSPPAVNLLPSINGLHTGIVTALDDEDGEYRVRVKLPVINNDGDGVWSRIATLDAGNNRGTFFRPEINDEVVVGFFNNDPRNPVILGMLNSSALPAPLEPADENNEKGYVSRSSIKMIFNDDKKSLTIETPAGKKIIIDEEAGKMQLLDENNNSITLNADGIKIESAKAIELKATTEIKLSAGTNISLNADAQFKVSGSAGAEVSSTGVTTIKGSLVQIN